MRNQETGERRRVIPNPSKGERIGVDGSTMEAMPRCGRSCAATTANIAIRRVFVWLHRWVGLLLTGFLIVVGLTGSLITFNSEIERWISPQVYAPPRPGVAPLDLGTLAARAENLDPAARVEGISFTAPIRPWRK